MWIAVDSNSSIGYAMPDKRQHRGAHPEDARRFAPETWPALRRAVTHLSWLLSRGYALPSSLKIVGDRFELDARQRIAVRRAACSDQALQCRQATLLPIAQLRGRHLAIDGFNLLTTIETALGGGVLLLCRDGCVRDMASVHGNYRRVAETHQAIGRIGQFLARANVCNCTWWLDRPVSNSGRLRGWLERSAHENDWPWSIQLVPDADRRLIDGHAVVISADSGVIDHCGVWSNITPAIIDDLMRETRTPQGSTPSFGRALVVRLET